MRIYKESQGKEKRPWGAVIMKGQGEFRIDSSQQLVRVGRKGLPGCGLGMLWSGRERDCAGWARVGEEGRKSVRQTQTLKSGRSRLPLDEVTDSIVKWLDIQPKP